MTTNKIKLEAHKVRLDKQGYATRGTYASPGQYFGVGPMGVYAVIVQELGDGMVHYHYARTEYVRAASKANAKRQVAQQLGLEP